MRRVRTTFSMVLIGLASLGHAQPAEAQLHGVSFLIKIAADPSAGGTAIGAASGTINGSPVSIPELSWTKTHSRRSPLLEAGVGLPAGNAIEILALVNYGHAGADSTQVGQLGGLPLIATFDDYTFWGLNGGVRVTRKSRVGPYATITAGFRRISAINAVLTTTTLTSSAPIYQASSVPTFTFGGGMLWGDLSFAMGFEVAISYAGSPSKLPNQPTLPGGGTLTPASGAGSRWSLPIGIVLRF